MGCSHRRSCECDSTCLYPRQRGCASHNPKHLVYNCVFLHARECARVNRQIQNLFYFPRVCEAPKKSCEGVDVLKQALTIGAVSQSLLFSEIWLLSLLPNTFLRMLCSLVMLTISALTYIWIDGLVTEDQDCQIGSTIWDSTFLFVTALACAIEAVWTATERGYYSVFVVTVILFVTRLFSVKFHCKRDTSALGSVLSMISVFLSAGGIVSIAGHIVIACMQTSSI